MNGEPFDVEWFDYAVAVVMEGGSLTAGEVILFAHEAQKLRVENVELRRALRVAGVSV